MMTEKRENIPSEYRKTEEPGHLIRAHHRTILTFTADGPMRSSETYAADMIKKLY